MQPSREVKMPSGTTLNIRLSPFAVSLDLYKALLREMKILQLTDIKDRTQLYQQLFCIGFSSPDIERCLWECFKHCTYGPKGTKIDKDSFEAIEARDDYMSVCVEVTLDNVGPFVKSLYAEFQKLTELVKQMQGPA